MSESARIVLDVGGSSIKSGRVSGDLVEGFRTDAYDAQGTGETILAAYLDVIRAHVAAAESAISEVVLAHPGPFDYGRGICLVRGVAKLEGLYGRDLRAALAPVLPAESVLRFLNDAEAAILGEARYGAGRAFGRILGVTLGTGLGSAFVADGRAVRDGEGVPPGGEVYALPVGESLADDTFSVRGLRDRLGGPEAGERDLREIGRALQAGAREHLGAVQAFGAALGAFLHPLVTAFHGDGVLVLGGLANLYPWFGPALEGEISVPVRRGELGPRAPLLGA